MVANAMLRSRYAVVSFHALKYLLIENFLTMQGKVYDVTGNKAYQPGGSYHGECSSQLWLVCQMLEKAWC